MTLRTSLFLLSFLFAYEVSVADELLPKGQPPAMVSAKLLEGDELSIRQIVLVPVQTTEVRKITVIEFRTEIIGGKAVAKPVEVVKEVSTVVTKYTEQVQERRLSKAGFQVLDIAGKKIEGEALAKALSKERPVLFATQSKPLDPFYATFFKEGTLVVYVHSAEGAAHAAVAVPAAIPVFSTVPALPVPEPIRSKPPK